MYVGGHHTSKSDKIMWVIYWSCISQFICFQKIHVPMLLPFFFIVSYLLLELNPAGVNVNERGRWVMWMKVEGMLFPYTAASWDNFFHAQIKLVSVTLAVKLTNLEPQNKRKGIRSFLSQYLTIIIVRKVLFSHNSGV